MQSVLTKAHGCKRTNVVNPKLNSDLIRDALTFYVAKSDSSGITATFQFTSSSHCTGLLIVDINCYSNIYLVGYTSKVTTLSESKAGYTQPLTSIYYPFHWVRGHMRCLLQIKWV